MSVRPERKLPEYPHGVVEGTNAVVRVKLQFKSADAAPVAVVTFNNGGPAFASTVTDHVSNYRLPCLPSGGSFIGLQEFRFAIEERISSVHGSQTRHVDGYLKLPPECLTQIRQVAPPIFPADDPYQSARTPGTVVVRLKFSAPDTAPEVTIVFDGGRRRLREAVRNSVIRYRMPCLLPGETPFSARQTFSFRIDGADTTELVPKMSLVQLLSLVKNLKQQTVRFDLTTMGCPFEIRLAPFQPYATNDVSEVGSSDPGRREFIEWLRNVTIDLPPHVMKSAIGEPTTVSVPCALLDFT